MPATFEVESALTDRYQTTVPEPGLGQFLDFLACDIARHPERLQSVNAGFVQRLQSLVGRVDVDLDAALSADEDE